MDLYSEEIVLAVGVEVGCDVVVGSVEAVLTVSDFIAVYIDIVRRLNAAEGDVNSSSFRHPCGINVKAVSVEADRIGDGWGRWRKYLFIAVCTVIPRIDKVGIDREVKALSLPRGGQSDILEAAVICVFVGVDDFLTVIYGGRRHIVGRAVEVVVNSRRGCVLYVFINRQLPDVILAGQQFVVCRACPVVVSCTVKRLFNVIIYDRAY